MKRTLPWPALLLLSLAARTAAAADGEDGWLGRLEEKTTFNSAGQTVRARLKGALDLELYHLEKPAAELVYAGAGFLPNPRLSLDLDAQLGRQFYAFVHSRADRGFDPADSDAEVRLDEYALRWTPGGPAGVSVQAGKFATVVGNWTKRHTAWDNPFVTAPLPYDNLTAVWDVQRAPSPETLLAWAHVRPLSGPAGVQSDKSLRLPIVWGPAYTTGVSVAAAFGRVEVAAELKNAVVASRPGQWDLGPTGWHRPAAYARVGVRPNEMWNLGVSFGRGDYLTASARRTLPAGARAAQRILAADASYAWHHLQLWGEVYAAEFDIGGGGRVGTIAYYVEAKRKLTPQFYAALRWGQQFFDEVTLRTGERVRWGREAWRAEAAAGYRLSAHAQLKLQFSLRHETPAPDRLTSLSAAQWTVRF